MYNDTRLESLSSVAFPINFGLVH